MAFKAPKQTDVKQWSKVVALLRAGYRFKPDLGNPFEESPPQKKPHPEKLPSSEFRKPSRKRKKNAQQARTSNGGCSSIAARSGDRWLFMGSETAGQTNAIGLV